MTWIPVGERLPEDLGPGHLRDLIAYATDGTVYVAYYSGGRWWTLIGHDDSLDLAVTHWQPLPEPPTKD